MGGLWTLKITGMQMMLFMISMGKIYSEKEFAFN